MPPFTVITHVSTQAFLSVIVKLHSTKIYSSGFYCGITASRHVYPPTKSDNEGKREQSNFGGGHQTLIYIKVFLILYCCPYVVIFTVRLSKALLISQN